MNHKINDIDLEQMYVLSPFSLVRCGRHGIRGQCVRPHAALAGELVTEFASTAMLVDLDVKGITTPRKFARHRSDKQHVMYRVFSAAAQTYNVCHLTYLGFLLLQSSIHC